MNNYLGMKLIYSKLEKLRNVLESQSIQLLNVLDQEKDHCEFLERTLDTISDQTQIWKTVNRQDTVREIRRKSEANPRFEPKPNYSPRLLSPSGLRSENSRRPSADIRMDGQNIYTNMITPRANQKPNLSTFDQKPDLEFSDVIFQAKERGIFSRRATVIESVAVTQRWNKDNHSANQSPERISASPKTMVVDPRKVALNTKMPSSVHHSGEQLSKQSSTKIISNSRAMNHGPSSQKSIKQSMISMIGESRKESFVRQPKPQEELEHQGRHNVLKEANMLAEDLNTTLKKLKIKSRGLLEKLSENRLQTSKGIEAMNSFKRSPTGPKQTEVASGELRVLSLAIPATKEKSPASLTTLGRFAPSRPV